MNAMMISPRTEKRTRTILQTAEGQPILSVLCVDHRKGSVLAIIGDVHGDCFADGLNLADIRGLNPNDEYLPADDVVKLLEKRADNVISDDGRMEIET